MLEFVEELAIKNKKAKLRFDCAENNEFLNNYYEKAGYIIVGKCTDGLYKGNKRENRKEFGDIGYGIGLVINGNLKEFE